MMKDDVTSEICISSVVTSYTFSEWRLDARSSTVPWDPLRLSIDANGECKLTICCSRSQVGGH